jgi:hypothetical protein
VGFVMLTLLFVFCVVVFRSLFVLFLWPLHYIPYFDILLLITHVIFSNFSYQIVRGKYLEFKLVQIVSEIYCWEQRPTCLCHVHSVETKLHTKHIRQNKIIKKKSKWTNTHMYWVEINKQEIR